jgi:formate dehydrogenase subunit gamma
MIWDQYFYGWTPIPTKRVALLIHSLAAVIAIAIIIVHIYAGIWIKGTGRAMTRGFVTGGWAYLHHRKWLRQVRRGDQGTPDQHGGRLTPG